jgi:H+/gluconate symporter-like permease
MPRAGCEPVTPATERLQTYALNRVATGIGTYIIKLCNNQDFHSVVGSHKIKLSVTFQRRTFKLIRCHGNKHDL